MERVSGVLTQLRASRLQQLTALHEHVRAKVQGLLATLADGEDAVHQLIAAGCTKVRCSTACGLQHHSADTYANLQAAAPSTSETAGKARKASGTADSVMHIRRRHRPNIALALVCYLQSPPASGQLRLPRHGAASAPRLQQLQLQLQHPAPSPKQPWPCCLPHHGSPHQQQPSRPPPHVSCGSRALAAAAVPSLCHQQHPPKLPGLGRHQQQRMQQLVCQLLRQQTCCSRRQWAVQWALRPRMQRPVRPGLRCWTHCQVARQQGRQAQQQQVLQGAVPGPRGGCHEGHPVHLRPQHSLAPPVSRHLPHHLLHQQAAAAPLCSLAHLRCPCVPPQLLQRLA
jgi:hypothetical protein